MAMPTGSENWNLEAVAHARGLLERAQELGVEVARLDDSVAAIVRQRQTRLSILKAASKLRADAVVLDDQIVDYWRVDPSGSQNYDPQWFVAQMSTRAIVRDALIRYVNNAEDTVHEIALRGITRATLWVSTLTLVFAFVAAVPVLRDLVPSHEARTQPSIAPSRAAGPKLNQ